MIEEEDKVRKAIQRARENAINYFRGDGDLSFHVIMLWLDNELMAIGFSQQAYRKHNGSSE